MIKKILKRASLSDKEIEIYLAGLKTGPALANSLAKKTNISRQNTYDVLKKLTKKGLASATGKAYNTLFIMESPQNLERFLERQKEKIDKAKEELALAIPEIESLYKQEVFIPKIKFYEGKEAMKNLMLETLKCSGKEIKAVVSTKDFYENLGVDFAKEYVEKRAKKKIKTKTVRLKSKEANEKYFSKHKEQLREMRYAPSYMSFSSTFAIYDDTVVFFSSQKEDFGLAITSKEYKEMMESLFEVLWRTSNKAK